MTLKNTVFLGRDNEVEIIFSGVDLTTFTSGITLDIGGESYSTISNPSLLYVTGTDSLTLKIGDTTALDVGRYTPEIVGYNPSNYDDGFLLTCKELKAINIYVKQC